jgi:hypothetical protein
LMGEYDPPDVVFVRALAWLPWYFAGTFVVLAVAWRRLQPKSAMDN